MPSVSEHSGAVPEVVPGTVGRPERMQNKRVTVSVQAVPLGCSHSRRTGRRLPR